MQKKLFKFYLADMFKISINFMYIIFLLRKDNFFVLLSPRAIVYINKKIPAEGLLDTEIDINIMTEVVVDAVELPIYSLNRI